MKNLFAFAIVLLASSVAAEDRPKILVLDLQVAGGTGPDIANAFTEAIAQEVDRRGYFESLSSSDVRTILGVERQRQLVGGCDEGTSCQAELAGALGARFALTGTIAKLGEVYQLTLQTVDTQKAQPIARSTRVARSYDILREQLPWAIAEATGTPLPPVPTHVLPYSLMGSGALLLAAGGVVGVQTLTQEEGLITELQTGEENPSALKFYSHYETQNDRIALFKTASVGAMILGAALVGGGVYLYRSENTAVSVAVVPTGSGIGFAGVLP